MDNSEKTHAAREAECNAMLDRAEAELAAMTPEARAKMWREAKAYVESLGPLTLPELAAAANEEATLALLHARRAP